MVTSLASTSIKVAQIIRILRSERSSGHKYGQKPRTVRHMDESPRDEVAGGVERPRDIERAIKFPELKIIHGDGGEVTHPPLKERCVSLAKGST
jgi:hypothetical protein